MKITAPLLALVSLPLLAAAPATPARTLPETGQLESWSGTPVTLAGLRGKTVVIQVGASWCKPCLSDFSLLVSMQARLAAANVAVVAVSLDVKKDAVATVIDASAPSFPVLYGPLAEEWAEKAGLDKFPATIVLDKDGHERWRGGKLEGETLAAFEKAVPAAAEPKIDAAIGATALAEAQKGRHALAEAARADDKLLAWPDDPAVRTARLAHAVEVLAKESAALDAATGGLAPAELLRASCHWHNALDRARAGLAAALRALPDDASPLGPDALERRILLLAGLDDAARAAALPKLSLARTVTLTLAGNTQATLTLQHAGWMIAKPAAPSAAQFWSALLSPETRRGWMTAYDLRDAWIFLRQGRIPPANAWDSVRGERIRDLATIFSARNLYAPDPALRAGDLLVFAIPWEPSHAVMMVRSYDPAKMIAEVVYIDVEKIHANEGELVVRQFPLSFSPENAPKRYVRPGLLWLRPATTPTPEFLARILKPLPWPGVMDWAAMPAQEPLPQAGAPSAAEAVRRMVERAGGGFGISGFTEDERLASTTWAPLPRDPERISFAKGYTVIGPKEENGKVRFDVVYDQIVMTDANGTRFDVKSAAPAGTSVSFLVEKVGETWKVTEPKEPPAVLLASRSRLRLDTSAADPLSLSGALADAYRRHGRHQEEAATWGAIATAHPKDAIASYNEACGRALAGDKPGATKALEEALRRGYRDADHIRDDHDLEIFGDDEIDVILRKYGL